MGKSKEWKWGYVSAEGEFVIAPAYDGASDFSEGMAAVKKGKTGLWGYIATAGRIAISARFRQAKSFHEGLAAVLTAVE